MTPPARPGDAPAPPPAGIAPIALSTLDRPLAIVGATGSGKTYAAKGAAEGLLAAGRRVLIIDPTGVWWGLRQRADGSPGYPVVIFGGEHSDVPVGPDVGERLGRLLAGPELPSVIVDAGEMSSGETIRLLTPLFEALYAANRSALHLVIDEADALAPQNPMPEARRLLGVVDKIARRGRVKGFRLLTITQRPAVLNKNVLSQVATLVALRLGAPQDRRALDAWIQGNADAEAARAVLADLPRLPTGTGYVWSPAEDRLDRVAFPAIATLDTSRAPEPGEAVAAPAPLADLDIAALRAALATPAAAAESERSVSATDPPAAEAERHYSRGYEAGLAEGRRLAREDHARHVEALAVAIGGALGEAVRLVRDPGLQVLTDAPASIAVSAPAPDPAAHRRDAPASLNGAARKLLRVLDTDPPVRRSWAQVATLAGLRARGGHYNAGRKALLDAGLVVAERDLVRVARPSAAAPSPTVDAEALVETWAAVLGGAAARILRHLHRLQALQGLPPGRTRASSAAGGTPVVVGPGPVTREVVADHLSLVPRGGHWNAAWKALRDNGLVVETDGAVRLSDVFGAPR